MQCPPTSPGWKFRKFHFVPAYEVHISHIDQREPFRAISVTAPACVGQLYGHGFQGYLMAMDHFLEGGA